MLVFVYVVSGIVSCVCVLCVWHCELCVRCIVSVCVVLVCVCGMCVLHCVLSCVLHCECVSCVGVCVRCEWHCELCVRVVCVAL